MQRRREDADRVGGKGVAHRWLAPAGAAALVLAFALAAGGCGGGGGATGPGGGSGGAGGASDCPTFAEVTIWPRCVACHASTLTGEEARHKAPAGVDFDVYAVAANNANTAKLYVDADLMPPPPESPATAAQAASLNKWISCGTPP